MLTYLPIYAFFMTFLTHLVFILTQGLLYDSYQFLNALGDVLISPPLSAGFFFKDKVFLTKINQYFIYTLTQLFEVESL